ncbi:MAG TPA: hypothetical protein VGV07_26945 [Devosia sp.]|jgi:hypothetical protein|uniref:hypothetical protein n=1 Tax=Devosia sp. TaxID=1871048 RepID=UPI002DDCB690|nr:hypothetical protein [Devosia sp.]HEV2518914.1 hypothetical protein [Devosia sp.]
MEVLGASKVLAVGLLMCLVVLLSTGPSHLQGLRTAALWQGKLSTMPRSAERMPGTLVAIDARIAADAEPVFRSFVAFVAETKRGEGLRGGTSWWIEEEQAKSAFAVETPQRRLSLVANDYDFTPMREAIVPGLLELGDVLVLDWDHHDYREENFDDGAAAHGRYRGLVATEPVFVIGTLLGQDRIDAHYVMAGTRHDFEALLARMATGAEDPTGHWFMVISAAAAAAAGLIVCWGIFVVWRRSTVAPRSQ